MKPTIVCLLGPTASGKTPLAIELVKRFPCEIISVDSAMVYKDMDIGTAKPTQEILQIAPHRLINLLDPKEIYSAGQFRNDALREIESILAINKIPLLVGGTMMYFRVLQQGLAKLPSANLELRADLSARAKDEGWESLHAYLASVDPDAAKKINPHDSQRIQRALEVYLLTGKTISAWQAQETDALSKYHIINIAIAPTERADLHARIAERFEQMLEAGFIDEVKRLYARGDLHADLPSIRSVGYRQVWNYLQGFANEIEMREQVLAATRQLAKRQMTWLRSWKVDKWLHSEDENLVDSAGEVLREFV